MRVCTFLNNFKRGVDELCFGRFQTKSVKGNDFEVENLYFRIRVGVIYAAFDSHYLDDFYTQFKLHKLLVIFDNSQNSNAQMVKHF